MKLISCALATTQNTAKMEQFESTDHYVVLGVEETASVDDIKVCSSFMAAYSPRMLAISQLNVGIIIIDSLQETCFDASSRQERFRYRECH